MHLHPQGGENFFSGLTYRKNVYVHPQDTKCTPPQPEQESVFRIVFAGWLRFGGIFRRSLRVTTKKKVVNFFDKKVHPRQNPGYAYVV